MIIFNWVICILCTLTCLSVFIAATIDKCKNYKWRTLDNLFCIIQKYKINRDEERQRLIKAFRRANSLDQIILKEWFATYDKSIYALLNKQKNN